MCFNISWKNSGWDRNTFVKTIQRNMKKIIGITALAFITLVSCKKDYSCECTTTISGVSQSDTYTITDHYSDAEAKCNNGDMSTSGSTTECDLDKI